MARTDYSRMKPYDELSTKEKREREKRFANPKKTKHARRNWDTRFPSKEREDHDS
jgi:hypothetical protein